MRMNKIVLVFAFVLAATLLINLVHAEATVCCEETRTNLFCQDVPAEQCKDGALKAPTSCKSTSYCKLGTCYDSNEGLCIDNTPQKTCNAKLGGVWSATSPPQCALGCCILGDQAAFVTLVRCKKLSASLGITTNYRKDITDEVQCVMSVRNQDKGACVYESEFERRCITSTRADCENGNSTLGKTEFFVGKLCSASELGTKCGPTEKTTCVPGKEGVYFIDSCGNPGNIYDASKVNDKLYWTNMVDTAQSCTQTSGNYGVCGNCDYLQGSYCRKEVLGGRQATVGDYVCADLNCKGTSAGDKKHGESWCIYDDAGGKDNSNNAVGSRFYKHVCINGEELLEACQDFRQYQCIESSIAVPGGTFSQAACRPNRWQFCLVQDNRDDCENTDKGDCVWKEGTAEEGLTFGNATAGACLPKNTPGQNFWTGEEAKATCAQASSTCIVKYEKDLFGSKKCVENCGCLTEEWKNNKKMICQAVGDCGPKVNWFGSEGFTKTKSTAPGGLSIYEAGRSYIYSITE